MGNRRSLNTGFGAGKKPGETLKSCVNWYDYGARMYDAAIGRFYTIDNSSENYYSHTPYNYVGNNPIKRIDPDGNNWLDKIAGCAIGAVTNIVPGSTGLRNSYTPTDASDYNNALAASDIAAATVGDIAQKGGTAAVVGGLSIAAVAGTVTLSTGGTTSPGTIPGAGLAIAEEGAKAVIVGTVLKVNAANNAAAGYN